MGLGRGVTIILGGGVLDSHINPKQDDFLKVFPNTTSRVPKDDIIAIIDKVEISIYIIYIYIIYMSLIGSVSLTDIQDGLYLGKVNIDNLNIDPNQILYSNDGINISGLTLSNGLAINGEFLETTGNPNIQLTSNSIYINDNEQTIQSGIDSSSQADVLYISSGSFGEPQLQINNKYNIALTAPSTASTICEILNGLVIDGTSELIRLSNLQIKGINTQIYGVGRQRLENIVFTGTSLQTNTIQIGHNSTKYMTFLNCEFDNYCVVQIPITFASVIYFINCNFGGCSFSLSQASNQQVIFTNCAGFQSFPVNATYIGLNVLTTGVSKVDTTNVNLTTINNSAYPPSGNLSCTNQADNRIITATSVNDVLTGESNLSFDGSKLIITSASDAYCVGKSTNSVGSASVSVGDTKCGNNSVSFGVLSNATNASVSIGYNCGKLNQGSYNVLMGSHCGYNMTSGNGNVCIGSNNSQNLTTGINNVILGISSGSNQTTQSNNSIVGYNSNCRDGLNTYNNCSVLGANILNGVISGNNQVQLGDSATNTYIYGVLQIRSDKRDKSDIQTLTDDEGLSLINQLNPVKYKYDYREDYNEHITDISGNVTTIQHPKDGSKKRNRYHYGLIGQEVEDLIQTNKIQDFGLLQNHNMAGERYTLGYEELISSLIKAVQQLSSQNKNLENRIKLLESKISP